MIGLLTTQLLVSQAVDVIAIDTMPHRLVTAEKFGAGRWPQRMVILRWRYASTQRAVVRIGLSNSPAPIRRCTRPSGSPDRAAPSLQLASTRARRPPWRSGRSFTTIG